MVIDAIFLVLVGTCAVSDLACRRLPDPLTATLAISGVAVAVVGGDVVAAMDGIAIGLLLLLPALAARWVGAGDVKLVAALGAWLGPVGILWSTSVGLALGAVLAIAMAIAAGVGRELVRTATITWITRTLPRAPRRSGRPDLVVPLALPLVITAVATRMGAL